MKGIARRKNETDEELQKRKEVVALSIQFNDEPTLLYAARPDLRDEKKVELYTKYRAVVPPQYKESLCPYPGDEVMEQVLKIKDFRKQMKEDIKKKREQKQEERKAEADHQKVVEDKMKDLEAINGFEADHIESDDEDQDHQAEKETDTTEEGKQKSTSEDPIVITFGTVGNKSRNITNKS